jgi:hypothetical protein
MCSGWNGRQHWKHWVQEFLSQSQFCWRHRKLSVNEAQFLIYMWSTTNCRRYTASQVNGKVSSYLLFFGGLKLTSHWQLHHPLPPIYGVTGKW